MAKTATTAFVCQSCGEVHSKWSGKCNGCGEWNTLVEEVTGGVPGRPRGAEDGLETLRQGGVCGAERYRRGAGADRDGRQ